MGRQLMASGWRSVRDTGIKCFSYLWVRCRKQTKMIGMLNNLYEISNCTAQSCSVDEHGFVLAGTATLHEQAGRAVQHLL